MANLTKKNGNHKKGRRRFLKTVALGAGAVAIPSAAAGGTPGSRPGQQQGSAESSREEIEFPRRFTGNRRQMISFPLGGVGAGSISLGGRGQLREWWIFNRPDKGKSPEYAFPSIWVQTQNKKPMARVLEARILPPYEGSSGLGSANVPGLPRLASSTFTGEFPLAHIDFEDEDLPVNVGLEAFTPFIPLEPDDSGLPVAILRYTVTNPRATGSKVAIAFSIENPVGQEAQKGSDSTGAYGRVNERRSGRQLEGLLMKNPFLPASSPLAGTFALGVLNAGAGQLSYLRGWPSATWWESPLLFWDDFSSDGELGPEAAARTAVGSICLQRDIPGRDKAEFTFLLSWHFPNRTPARCGWSAPKGHENDLIGNYYCTRFKNAWEAAEYAAEHLPQLESLTKQFASVVRETTLPGAVKDAASANLSTLAAQTSFRTTDGAFHGFEGCDEHSGCCFGSCTHVYAYEATIANVFPQHSHSLREQQFGFLTNSEGLMDYRELLPFGIENWGHAAADGQMACIMKLYYDWRLSGDTEWLRKLWPAAKRALEFSWISGGWDANRDGVMEGVQHNTYDVEFIGPNPLCGIWYLGGLRAGEEIAKAVGDDGAANEYCRLFDEGSQWIDANLFNGEYYVQQIGSIPHSQVAKGLNEGADTENPTFQLGEGCLADQLMGQYYAQIAGLGLLLDSEHIRATLGSIYKYNYKRTLDDHECVMRTYSLNDEPALVVCTYPHGNRPRTPFPYFQEVWTGIEYATAALMIYMGMTEQGTELIASSRRRYDGAKRNPWDEPECGYHYARPMSSWAGLLALSGFRYHGAEKAVEAKPLISAEQFSSFWSTASGWGSFQQRFQHRSTRFSLSVIQGNVICRSVILAPGKSAMNSSSARVGSRQLSHQLRKTASEVAFLFPADVAIEKGQELVLTLG